MNEKRMWILLVGAVLLVSFIGAPMSQGASAEEGTPTITFTPSPTATSTHTRTLTPTSSATITRTPTRTVTQTATGTLTPTVTPSPTPTVIQSATSTSPPAPSPTPTATDTDAIIGEIKHSIPVLARAYNAIVADWDSDGIMEIVAAFHGGDPSAPNGYIAAYEFNGTEYLEEFRLNSPTKYPMSINVGDVNGDGINEIVLGTGRSDAGGYLYVVANGNIVWTSNWIGSMRRFDQVSLGDSDGDGEDEIAIAVMWYGRYLALYDHVGNNNFQRVFFTGGHGDGHDSGIGDIDGDGENEVIFSMGCFSSTNFRAYRFNGTTYSNIWNKRVSNNNCYRPFMVIGDADNDGDDEIVSTFGEVWQAEVLIMDGSQIAWWGGPFRPGGQYRSAYPSIGSFFNNGKNQIAFVAGSGSLQDFAVLFVEHDGTNYRYAGMLRRDNTIEAIRAYIGDSDNDGENELVLTEFSGVNNWINVYTYTHDEAVFAIDGNRSVWRSEDQGETWTQATSEYHTSAPKTIVSNSNGDLFVVSANSEILKSLDQGETWSVVNSDYNGGEIKSDWLAMACSKADDTLYIIEKNGDDVWRSVDYGVTWEKVNDNYNGGVNPAPKGAAVDTNGHLFVVDGNADVWKTDDLGVTWTKINDDYNGSRNNYAEDYVIGDNAHYIVMGVGGASYVYRSMDGGITFEDMGKISQYGAAGALAYIGGSLYGAINYGNDGPDVHRSDDEAGTWSDGVEVLTTKNIVGMSGASFIATQSVPTPTATLEPTSTLVPSPIPTATPLPTSTMVPTPTGTPTRTPTLTGTPTRTPTPTATCVPGQCTPTPTSDFD